MFVPIFVNASLLQAVIYVLILANAVVLGFETAEVLSNTYDSAKWFPAELVFIVIFLVEQVRFESKSRLAIVYGGSTITCLTDNENIGSGHSVLLEG